MRPFDAVVVGAGPNGLSAALSLAQAGHSVCVVEGQPTLGGSARTQALTLPGFQHDVCSAVHPMAAASPFFKSLPLAAKGVRFIHSPVALAHPLDGAPAVALRRSVEETASGLGVDEGAYVRMMRPLVDGFEDVLPLLLNPLTRPPRRGFVTAARFAAIALRGAVQHAEDTFEGPRAKALLGGCAAHSLLPLNAPLSAGVGVVLALLGHAVGWPIVEGGSQRLMDALAALLVEAGGEVRLGQPVTSLEQLPPSRLVLFDTHARSVARIARGALPGWYAHALEEVVLSPGIFKLDYALSAPMPWTSKAANEAATLHLGGTLPELAASEAAPHQGVHPERPYVLVAQSSRFDVSRAPAGQHTLWAYCHVPSGDAEDASARVEAQFDRFAPGWRALVLARATKTTAQLEAGNASLVAGDITGGSGAGFRTFLRPVPYRPYATPNPRLILCSSSTPPGPAVHGMCGVWAAELAKSRLRGGV